MRQNRFFRPGIRRKLPVFLFPMALLLVSAVTWTGSKIAENTMRKDLLSRGAAISRAVAFSASRLLLDTDQFGRNRLAEDLLSQQADLQTKTRQLEEAYIGMARVIAASPDARAPYTLGHSTRVARRSREMGRRLGFSEESLEVRIWNGPRSSMIPGKYRPRTPCS